MSVLGDLDAAEVDGLGIFLSHGVLDGLTTTLAFAELGASGEGNPLVAALLAQGIGYALGVMLAVTGAVAVVYPTLSDHVSRRWAWSLIVVGVVVAVLNLGIVVLN